MLCIPHTVHSLSPCPRRKTYHTFKHLRTHVAEADPKLFLGAFFSLLQQHLLKDATCGLRKESRAISITYHKPAVPPASGDLQQLPGFTSDCKHEGKRKREEEVGSSVCRTVS